MPDFETMPLGTREELAKLREIAAWLASLSNCSDPSIRARAYDLQKWYQNHLERYPL